MDHANGINENGLDKTMSEGFPNMLPFIGVVEDNDDTMRMGRVRVRAFGFHSDNRSEIPTETLPWATLVSGT